MELGDLISGQRGLSSSFTNLESQFTRGAETVMRVTRTDPDMYDDSDSWEVDSEVIISPIPEFLPIFENITRPPSYHTVDPRVTQPWLQGDAFEHGAFEVSDGTYYETSSDSYSDIFSLSRSSIYFSADEYSTLRIAPVAAHTSAARVGFRLCCRLKYTRFKQRSRRLGRKIKRTLRGRPEH